METDTGLTGSASGLRLVNEPAPPEVGDVVAGTAPDVGDVVEVLWDDASYQYDVPDVDKMADDWPTLTWGRLSRVGDSGALFVAGEWFPDEDGFRAVTRIPASLVRGIRVLGKTDAG